MNDFTHLVALTAGAFTLEDIERITGGTVFPEWMAGNKTGWAVRVDGETYSLQRTTPPTERPGQFVISDPDLCRMADGMDAMDDYAEEQNARLAAMRGVA